MSKTIIAAAIATFPATFELRGHEGTFRIGLDASYVNSQGVPMLYTQRRVTLEEYGRIYANPPHNDDCLWLDFAKGTEAELRQNVIPLAAPVASPVPPAAFPLQSAYEHAHARLLVVRDIVRSWHDDGTAPDECGVDVRLMRHADGSFQLTWGDVSGDTHHAPHCAAGLIAWDATNPELRDEARRLARELRDAVEADDSE